MRKVIQCIYAGALAAAISLLLMGASCGPNPPNPHPTPTPQPTATPTPVPTPTPTPTPPTCATLESFKLAYRQQARKILDATPGHGFPACVPDQGKPCTSPGGSFQRLSPEGGSTECETLAGPYTWTLNEGSGAIPCGTSPCDQGGNCFSNNDNPLQYVFCRGGLAQVKGGNGAASFYTVPF